MYKMYLGINNGEEGFMLPVLPAKIEFNEDGDNKTYNIINLGEINTINKTKLIKVNFESFFPQYRGPYVNSEQLFEPSFYISKIREWRDKSQKVRFIFTGSPLDINDLFTIENLKLFENGGEVGDIYYSLELKRYKPYASKKIIIPIVEEVSVTKVEEVNIEIEPPPREVERPEIKTHVVGPGDTLWGLAKQYLGDGSRYMEIANLNSISNPDLIIDGQVLQIP